MIQLKRFTWNPFSENSYVLSDETGECIIIDPGCYEGSEQNELVDFIAEHELTPVLLVNTHCHVDHVLGNRFVFQQYGLLPVCHELELEVLHAVPSYTDAMGINYELSPEPNQFIEEFDEISFGNSTLMVIFVPGHSPGSVAFYSKADRLLISGDTLFLESIGRTDLPGGDMKTLLTHIREKLFRLEPSTRVFPGHGPDTTIAHEMEFNPYL